MAEQAMTVALDILRRFWPAIPIAVLAVALLLTRSTNARHRAELAACSQARKIDQASIKDLNLAISDQNDKIAAWAEAGKVKSDAAAKALDQAAERVKANQSTIDALRRSAALKRPENAPCVISDTLAGAKGL